MTNQPFDYRFQGQELQEEYDLNWYAYRYRNYDPAIGRFFNVDPLTEQYHEWGVYVFSGNRVVDSFELEGLEPVVSTEQADELGIPLDHFDDRGLLALGGELKEVVINFQGREPSNTGSGNYYVPFLSEMKGYVDPFLPSFNNPYNDSWTASYSTSLSQSIENSTALNNFGDYHAMMDIMGTAPLLGEPIDIANGVLYTWEGDYVNAGLDILT